MTPRAAILPELEQRALARSWQLHANRAARDHLVLASLGLVQRALARWPTTGADAEDLAQTGRLALVACVARYPEGDPRPFGLWAYLRITGAMGRAWRRLAQPATVSLADDESAEVAMDGSQDVDAAAAAIRTTVARLVRCDPQLRVLVRQRTLARDPATLAAVGAALGVSRERARQLELQLYDRLRARLCGGREMRG